MHTDIQWSTLTLIHSVFIRVMFIFCCSVNNYSTEMYRLTFLSDVSTAEASVSLQVSTSRRCAGASYNPGSRLSAPLIVLLHMCCIQILEAAKRSWRRRFLIPRCWLFLSLWRNEHGASPPCVPTLKSIQRGGRRAPFHFDWASTCAVWSPGHIWGAIWDTWDNSADQTRSHTAQITELHKLVICEKMLPPHLLLLIFHV